MWHHQRALLLSSVLCLNQFIIVSTVHTGTVVVFGLGFTAGISAEIGATTGKPDSETGVDAAITKSFKQKTQLKNATLMSNVKRRQ